MNQLTVRQGFSAPIFGLLLCIVFASTGRTQDGGTWDLGAPMPVRRQETATRALNGRVYVLGGYDENRSSTATVEVYNPIFVVRADEMLTAFLELESAIRARQSAQGDCEAHE